MPRVTTAAATFLFFALSCLPAVLRAQDSCDSACPPDQKCFSGCGTLVRGVECVLFQADLGGLYILSNVGPFSVGDRGFVTGCIDPSCISFCQQGDGCILNNTIATCDDKHDFDGDGIGDSLDNCSQAANPAQDDPDLATTMARAREMLADALDDDIQDVVDEVRRGKLDPQAALRRFG